MIRAYDETYLEGAMIRLGDMLEYACLDCGYNADEFWEMFLLSSISKRFEVGDVSIVAGRSGPELAMMVMYEVDHRNTYPEPTWRESRSDLYWAGWLLAYFQWSKNVPFKKIRKSVSIRMVRKMYPTMHEADIEKPVIELSRLLHRKESRTIRSMRLSRGMSQKEAARRAKMSPAQFQRIERGERKIENISLKTAKALSEAFGVEIEELFE